MSITLREITKDNFEACIGLEVNDDQKRFVAPNMYSLAESKFYPGITTQGIYHDKDIVGFLMYGRDNESDDRSPWLIRFMIDARYQGKGYGKEAMVLTLEQMKLRYPRENIYLSTGPDNVKGIHFYEAFGFVSTGRIQYDELVFRLEVNR